MLQRTGGVLFACARDEREPSAIGGEGNMSRRWTFFFGEGRCEGDATRKDLLGGKGASLAAMSAAGLPVPPGFTIITEACAYFHDHQGQWPDGLEEEVRSQLARLERCVGRRFGDPKAPLLVSVRSGAAHSMPGMMDTILNCGLTPEMAVRAEDPIAFWKVYHHFVVLFSTIVAGVPAQVYEDLTRHVTLSTPDDYAKLTHTYLMRYRECVGRPFPTHAWDALAQCIDAVFRSWNNERAITYRKEHDIRGLHGTAVNIQCMFPSEISGIVFTANPNAAQITEMIIESSFGLGEAVVSGNVQPDRFVVDRHTLTVKSATIGHKTVRVTALGDTSRRDPDAPSLTTEQIEELARMGMQVEAFYGGTPMDIEWGWAGGKFALLQSRPIRGMEIVRDVEVGRQEDIARLRQQAAGRRRVWVKHNLDEILPSPTPLTWDIVRAFMTGDGGFGRMYQLLGYQPSQRVRKEGFLELIGGRIYADPERAAELFWDGMPLRYDVEAVSKNPKLMDTAPRKFMPEKADAAFLARLPRLLLAMWRCARNTRRLSARVVEEFENEVVPRFKEWVQRTRAQDLSLLSVPELIRELHERIEKGFHAIGSRSLMPGFFGGMAQADLEDRLVQIFGEEEGRALALRLTQGLEGDTTVEMNVTLYEWAQGKQRDAVFLEKYGHRAVGEMELSRPRYREDDTYLRQLMQTYRSGVAGSPAERHRENVQRRLEAEAQLPERLRVYGASSFLEEITQLMREAQKKLPYREIGKDYLIMGYETIRRVLEELARRWDLGRDIYFLHLDELETFETHRDALRATIARRKIRWQSAKRLDMPDVVDTNTLDTLGLPQSYGDASEWKGEPIASGVSTGPALIVFDPHEAAADCTNYILVCPSTDPSWTALFVNARGLIVEQGGILSHGAIVARDFGIPAVVCPGATKRIPNRATIRVDGNRGVITLLDRGAAHA